MAARRAVEGAGAGRIAVYGGPSAERGRCVAQGGERGRVHAGLDGAEGVVGLVRVGSLTVGSDEVVD
ncbi:hypothetical protein AMK22_10500 [Streptomyces sp. CB01580]|nr:hypothetical protein AMK22_10500 [Streptomyces sp. CB01580]